MREARDLRVFFALWPDDNLRQRLQQTALRLAIERPARRVPDYNLHLTLHFIGNIYRAELGCLQREARAVFATPFELEIDRVGHFARPRVGWLGCSRVPEALASLHHDLGQRLTRCDYQPEARRFNPHVTVARKLQQQPAAFEFEALRWRVENFVLIESRQRDNGVQYEVIETYPLS